MSPIVQVADPENRYVALTSVPVGGLRHMVTRLGEPLATATRAVVEAHAGSVGSVLCTVILRGGALLYPGFSTGFNDADFCMIAIGREGDMAIPRHHYNTSIPNGDYDACIYIDCVSATGNTILEARRVVAGQCRAAHEFVAVISSAKTATDAFEDRNIGVIGFSLYEALDGNTVRPDLGERDAGELFSKAAPTESPE